MTTGFPPKPRRGSRTIVTAEPGWVLRRLRGASVPADNPPMGGGTRSLVDAVDDFMRRRPAGESVSLHLAAHAVEDLPAELREEGRLILSTPAGISLQRRDFDILENGVVDAYGHLECGRVLQFLSQYPVTPYTYEISSLISRGERPSPAKLAALAADGYDAVINLCAETPGGDAPALAAAGITGLTPYHIPIIDGTPPTSDQVVQLLDLLTSLAAQGKRVYIHCEAGKARTGVMTACIRMAMMGWSVADAMTEAVNFGCTVPMQQAFIEDFGAGLATQYAARAAGHAGDPALGRYPVLLPGSVPPSAQQLSATLDSVRRSDGGKSLG